MMRPITFLVAAMVVAAMSSGCLGGNVEMNEPANVVRAIWDPGEGVLPSPTDLVRNDGRLDIPIDDDARLAEREFTQYLNQLDGYPLSTPLRIPVSGPIDESSLVGAVTMVAAPDTRIAVRSTYDEEAQAIIVEPREDLLPGTTYVVGLRGYERGARGARGEMLVSDAAFFLLKSPNSLRDHPYAFPGGTPEERQERADELADLQEEFASAFAALDRRGMSRDEVAVLMQFTTTSTPAIRFDPGAGELPMPNELLFDRETMRVDLPIDSDTQGEELLIRQGLSQYDGFGVSGAIIARTTHRFASGPVPAEAFRLYERSESGGWSEVIDVERGRFNDGSAIWLRPRLTLEPNREYAYILTDELLSDTGRAHTAQPLGAMLRMSTPLFADGQSQLPSLNDEDAEQLEAVRHRVDELLTQLVLFDGLERDRVVAAVPFRTMSVIEPLLERRELLYERGVSTQVTGLATTEPSGALGLLLHDVETVVRGQMTVLDHIDPLTRAFYEDGSAVERQVKFVLTLPENVSVVDPIPVVLFGHGLATSRELLYLIAGPLARAGYAAFSLDLPYHGDRAVCIRDSACEEGATCNEDGQCRFGDGSQAQMRTVNASYLMPFLAGTQYDDLLNYPIGSGEVFVDIENIVATGDHFAQALLDLNQALRLLRSNDFMQAIVDETGLWLDVDDIVYLGMSLGGILGASLTVAEPEINDFVLNVPAADLTRLIEHSVTFQTSFEHALYERDLERGSDGYMEFLNIARWVLDRIDPLNVVQHTLLDPWPYEEVQGREARVMIQMADGDSVVPNVGTQILSERMGLALKAYYPVITDHAFLFNPNPFAESSRTAREDLVEFYDER